MILSCVEWLVGCAFRGALNRPASPAVARLVVRSLRDTRIQFTISRHNSPEVCYQFPHPPIRGAGKAGCALHPRSRVQNVMEKTHTSIQVQRRASGFPCAMVLRLIRDLPGESSSVATVTPRITSPTWRQRRGARTTRLRRPLKLRSSVASSASTASHRAFVTIAIRPSHRVGQANIVLICPTISDIFTRRDLKTKSR